VEKKGVSGVSKQVRLLRAILVGQSTAHRQSQGLVDMVEVAMETTRWILLMYLQGLFVSVLEALVGQRGHLVWMEGSVPTTTWR